ncbi:hypothetical protein ACFL0W_01685 [Nanoarchaeota archaeon]
MAKKVTKKTTVSNWKRKRWYKLIAPKIFNESFLGETPALEASSLLGRTVKVNLMNLTGDMKKQNISVTFKIIRLAADKAQTELKKYEMGSSNLKRIVRRGKDRIDQSVICQTKDGRSVRIKPLLLTRSNTTGLRLRSLRKEVLAIIDDVVNTITLDELAQDIVSNKFQKHLKQILSKVYPLRICDIRMLVVLDEASPSEKKEVVEGEKSEEQKPLEVKEAPAKVEPQAEAPKAAEAK